VWRQSGDGAITWANQAYLDKIAALMPDRAGTWPLARLFKTTSLAHPDTKGSRRIGVDVGEGVKAWFDVEGCRILDEIQYTATPIDATVRAEVSLRNFVQTLTGTFAHLQVGLAIFDRNRQLVLFNPALLDLTTLEPEWLSTRPLLGDVLDRMRDRNMLPEPKDYKSWRASLSALEADSREGLFEETWSLPNGQTLRIQARPHTEGGLAITLEDISSELSMTRRFRSEIELGQSVIDRVAPALAVFDRRGALEMSSRAYQELFQIEPDQALCAPTLIEASAVWQTVFDPSPVWGDIRDFGQMQTDRAEWEETLRARNGGLAHRCRVTPLAEGRTLVTFTPVAATGREPIALAKNEALLQSRAS